MQIRKEKKKVDLDCFGVCPSIFKRKEKIVLTIESNIATFFSKN